MPIINVDELRRRLRGYSVGFGIPSFNEGAGILPTLDSLWQGISSLGLESSTIILSDSSETLATVDAANRWSARVGSRFHVDRSNRRRSLKEALNVVFDACPTDLLVLINADVIVPASSLSALFHSLLVESRPQVVVGSILPDPGFGGLRFRAGAWQIRSIWRAASLMRFDAVRSEGAFWGTWRSFYSNFRYPVGTGSLADDIELSRAIRNQRVRSANSADAFVYKVPPGSLHDFCSGSIRFRAASPEHRRGTPEYAAAIFEAIRDPLGASLYALSRLWCNIHAHRLFNQSSSEMWMPLSTTKRGTKDH
jgi:hypothetical protein